MLTFQNGRKRARGRAHHPDDRLLIETDAPYLAPIPYRGKRNEPAMMVETAEKLAEVRGTTPERIAEITTANFERLLFAPAKCDPLHWGFRWQLNGQARSCTAREIFDLVREDLEQVEKAIDVESLASVETVTTIGRYLQQSGGKRLRPALLLLCARFAGGGEQDRHSARRGSRDDPRRHAGS